MPESSFDHYQHDLRRHVVTLRRWYVAARHELDVDEERTCKDAIETLARVAVELEKRRGYVRRRR